MGRQLEMTAQRVKRKIPSYRTPLPQTDELLSRTGGWEHAWLIHYATHYGRDTRMYCISSGHPLFNEWILENAHAFSGIELYSIKNLINSTEFYYVVACPFDIHDRGFLFVTPDDSFTVKPLDSPIFKGWETEESDGFFQDNEEE